ncbi:uncharacterized protein LACBIDRAFT_318905 [Laccaria bicolor S238N-H82]|uniref:Predicted protein n=1 Tax=Laccaria bicolor (strain S238N-H82 / ATCC MYA-4686) TaxID=486041 RepID=B0D7E1_LACBS|nr:uncharacterized protein LACBIDRAFT_318905 [Laccaria bicolor S238N-H82]EDR09637.1 predicted protein [Laccaria bicolor S238N-H82]|eukprot:XP_001879986.1 predicted protein [Laccaria bicolor S238N-H82]
MASIISRRVHFSRPMVRSMVTTAQQAAPSSSSVPPTTSSPESPPPNTHFKITMRRSAISLGEKIKGTVVSLGIHRRFQTVYHRHSPETAGKILKLKELLEVENVPEHLVLTKQQQRQLRKAPRGYKVVGTRRGSFMNI